MAKKKEITKPGTGEQTKKQAVFSGDVAGTLSTLPGFGVPARGTYLTYRQMRSNPSIALARAVSMAPIRTAPWAVKANDDAPKDRIDFVQEQVKYFWPGLIKNILFALDYGWSPFEKVWGVNKEGRLVYRKLKPLLVDKTKALVENKTGQFSGLRQGGIDLPINKSFIFTYDGEAGDTFGRSRHENIRTTAWNQWNEISKRFAQFAVKTASVIPIIQYPEGEGQDKDGNVKQNYELAKQVLDNLGKGSGVCMPNTLAAWIGDLQRSGQDVKEVKAWIIDFLEAKGNHGKAFIDMLRHSEALMMRGWLVPERAATEGQYGTKAESETQGELAMVIADLTFSDILQSVNWHIINPLLVYNFGLEAENTIWLAPGSIDPVKRKFFREIMKKILGDNVDLFMDWVDIDAFLDALDIPKAEETIVIEEPEGDETPPEPGQAEPAQPAAPVKPPKAGRLERFVKKINEWRNR